MSRLSIIVANTTNKINFFPELPDIIFFSDDERYMEKRKNGKGGRLMIAGE
jgi:hypothetical protein